MKFSKLLIILILMTGFILRFYKLGEFPVGLHRDEAFLGYNSYSILKTGKDMSGDTYPLHLRSFLYSPAGYSYFSIPAIALLGLNAYSTRFASALFGVLSIYAMYKLIIKIFPKNYISQYIATLSSLLLSISPWHINLSRTATENIISVYLLLFGTYVLLKWFDNYKVYYLLTSFTCFLVSMYTYQASRSFLPLFIPLSFILLDRTKFKISMILWPVMLYILTIIIPVAVILSSPSLSLRLTSVSIFNNNHTQLIIDEQIREDGVTDIQNQISRLFHNKFEGYTREFIKNLFSHFTYSFLFTENGFPERYKVPNSGLLYLIELPAICIGLYFLLKKHQKIFIFLIGWVLISFIGSALTFDDVPNLQRTLQAAPAFYIIISAGWVYLFQILKTWRKRILMFIIISYIYSISYYLHQYYIHQTIHRPWYRQEGYQLLVSKIEKIFPQYKNIVITNHESAPTIFFLFYLRYDPLKFITFTKNAHIKDFDRANFDKFEFSQQSCPLNDLLLESYTNLHTRISNEPTLYVNSFECQPLNPTIRTIDTIRRKDGTPVFILEDLN